MNRCVYSRKKRRVSQNTTKLFGHPRCNLNLNLIPYFLISSYCCCHLCCLQSPNKSIEEVQVSLDSNEVEDVINFVRMICHEAKNIQEKFYECQDE
jgi:hypothetical protein